MRVIFSDEDLKRQVIVTCYSVPPSSSVKVKTLKVGDKNIGHDRPSQDF